MTSDQESWTEARAQAEELLRAISAAESVIVTTIERECDAIRAGCMLAARALHTRLCDAVKFYLDAIRAARAGVATMEQVLPGSQNHLEDRREAFAAVLKVELAILASEYAACGEGRSAISFTGESLIGSARSGSETPRRASLPAAAMPVVRDGSQLKVPPQRASRAR